VEADGVDAIEDASMAYDRHMAHANVNMDAAPIRSDGGTLNSPDPVATVGHMFERVRPTKPSFTAQMHAEARIGANERLSFEQEGFFIGTYFKCQLKSPAKPFIFFNLLF
jgi:hypothetical protein